MFFDLTTILIHSYASTANGDAILTNREVIFLFGRFTALAINVNKRDNGFFTEVLIESHSIMGRIQKYF